MSKGYVSKKKLRLMKQRKLRKKYKNFSCSTCEKVFCGIPTPPFGMVITRRKNCPNWKARKS